MKLLFFVSCVVAVASASWIPIENKYHGPQHIPVIHNGVPVETAEVQHAKSAHLAALAEAVSHSGYQHEEEKYIDNESTKEVKYYGPQHVPVIHNGVPVETPEVQHAKAAHLSALAKASSHPAYQHKEAIYSHDKQNYNVQNAYTTSYVIPSIGHDGTPLDTPEVNAAKSHHFAAVHKALALTQHHRARRALNSQHIPIIDHNGVPVEPLEVQEARSKHLAAHAASTHSGVYGFTVHQNHAPVYGHHDSYNHYVPAIGHDGTPLDTPEVEKLKAAHFAALHEATIRNSIHKSGYGFHQA